MFDVTFARMFKRTLEIALRDALERAPAVALLGPRQVGKTTLALEITANTDALYLDLESERDRAKLADPEAYLGAHSDKLVILDEVHRAPNLFRSLRSLIDANRRLGQRTGQYLLLGSASVDLLRQSSESLAGRISYVELTPLTPIETDLSIDQHWFRGGFPDSLGARDNRTSHLWRRDFIRTYLERDIPDLGPRIPAETLRRFWTMIAHQQAGLFNSAEFARNLGVTKPTVARYLDLMVDLMLVRRLEPWLTNTGKRLRKSPKIMVRDSGLVHALLNIEQPDELLGHPVVGGSWEGFVIEALLNALGDAVQDVGFYRATGGAEIDLVMRTRHGLVAIEVKRSSAPKSTRSFKAGCDDLQPDHAFIVYNGEETFPLQGGGEAIGLRTLIDRLA
jgi:hypothetical protein